jgi:hypothetical protein
MSTAAVLAGTNLIILPVARNIFSSVSSIANNDFDDNNHRLRTRKFPKKSHFEEDQFAAENLCRMYTGAAQTSDFEHRWSWLRCEVPG